MYIQRTVCYIFCKLSTGPHGPKVLFRRQPWLWGTGPREKRNASMSWLSHREGKKSAISSNFITRFFNALFWVLICLNIVYNFRNSFSLSQKETWKWTASISIRVYHSQWISSAFRALWLVHSEAISKYYSTLSKRQGKTKWLPISLRLPRSELFYRQTRRDYSTCVLYTETIIHFSVDESDEYLPPDYSYPLRWIIDNYAGCLPFSQKSGNFGWTQLCLKRYPLLGTDDGNFLTICWIPQLTEAITVNNNISFDLFAEFSASSGK